MGGGGSISGMNSSLKNNRQVLRSKQKGFKHNSSPTLLKHKKMKFKELPLEELNKIKHKIRLSQKRRKRNQLLIFWGTVLVVILVIVFW